MNQNNDVNKKKEGKSEEELAKEYNSIRPVGKCVPEIKEDFRKRLSKEGVDLDDYSLPCNAFTLRTSSGKKTKPYSRVSEWQTHYRKCNNKPCVPIPTGDQAYQFVLPENWASLDLDTQEELAEFKEIFQDELLNNPTMSMLSVNGCVQYFYKLNTNGKLIQIKAGKKDVPMPKGKFELLLPGHQITGIGNISEDGSSHSSISGEYEVAEMSLAMDLKISNMLTERAPAAVASASVSSVSKKMALVTGPLYMSRPIVVDFLTNYKGARHTRLELTAKSIYLSSCGAVFADDQEVVGFIKDIVTELRTKGVSDWGSFPIERDREIDEVVNYYSKIIKNDTDFVPPIGEGEIGLAKEFCRRMVGSRVRISYLGWFMYDEKEHLWIHESNSSKPFGVSDILSEFMIQVKKETRALCANSKRGTKKREYLDHIECRTNPDVNPVKRLRTAVEEMIVTTDIPNLKERKLFPAENGIVCLKTKTIKYKWDDPLVKDMFWAYKGPKYDPTIDFSEFRDLHLYNIESREEAPSLEMAIGALMSMPPKTNCFVYQYGHSGAGKSSLNDMIVKVLGRCNLQRGVFGMMHSIPEGALTSAYELSLAMDGVECGRGIICNEVSLKDMEENAMLKTIANRGVVSKRVMQKGYTSVQISGLLLADGNILSKAGAALRNRLCVIKYDKERNINEAAPEQIAEWSRIKERIESNPEAHLAWFVDCASRYLAQQQLDIPKTNYAVEVAGVQKTGKELVPVFLESIGIIPGNEWALPTTSYSDLVSAFTQWCLSENRIKDKRYALSHDDVITALRDVLGSKRDHKHTNKNGKREDMHHLSLLPNARISVVAPSSYYENKTIDTETERYLELIPVRPVGRPEIQQRLPGLTTDRLTEAVKEAKGRI